MTRGNGAENSYPGTPPARFWRNPKLVTNQKMTQFQPSDMQTLGQLYRPDGRRTQPLNGRRPRAAERRLEYLGLATATDPAGERELTELGKRAWAAYVGAWEAAFTWTPKLITPTMPAPTTNAATRRQHWLTLERNDGRHRRDLWVCTPDICLQITGRAELLGSTTRDRSREREIARMVDSPWSDAETGADDMKPLAATLEAGQPQRETRIWLTADTLVLARSLEALPLVADLPDVRFRRARHGTTDVVIAGIPGDDGRWTRIGVLPLATDHADLLNRSAQTDNWLARTVGYHATENTQNLRLSA